MTSDIKTKKSEDEKQASSQRDESANKSKNRQKLKQILMKEFEN